MTQHFDNIASKANRVLNLILIALSLITFRIWHLSAIQHETRLEESRKPQNKVVIESAKRGTIRDRFNLPLAINKVQYNAAILYSQISHIPSVRWEMVDGKKVKQYKRRAYIKELSQLLGQELKLDPDRLEDLIHAKAALYNNLPYTIKEDLSEKEYYRLKMLEKDWPGLLAECQPKRFYPLGKVAGDLIGYMGAISREEYEKIAYEIQELEKFIASADLNEEAIPPSDVQNKEEAEMKLHALLEQAYSIRDSIGKTGIEGTFEKELRGYHGKRTYYSDAKGNFLRELPEGKAPVHGQRCLVTLSAELQEFAEQLLIQNENLREPRITRLENTDDKSLSVRKPWILGGAIVAMDPNNGELLACASYPRIDPNDFIASGNSDIAKIKNAQIRRWFETENYLAEIWDQKRPLEREVYDLDRETAIEEAVWMDWNTYLESVLPEQSPVFQTIKNLKTVGEILHIQQTIHKLMDLTERENLYSIFNLIYPEPFHQSYGPRLPAVRQENLEEILLANQKEISEIKKNLQVYFSKISQNYDKVLFIDLCQLIVDPSRITPELNALLERVRIADYRQWNATWVVMESQVKELTEHLYHSLDFRLWREENQTSFLKEKRNEEKLLGIKYPKPYLEHLDRKEKELFTLFWQTHRYELIFTFLSGKIAETKPDLYAYQELLLTWHKELKSGAHSEVFWKKAYDVLSESFSRLNFLQASSLMQSFRAFSDLERPLFGKYRYLKKNISGALEKHLAAAFYPPYGYGYGRSHAYRQATTQGSIFKIVTGYEALRQKYEKQNPKPRTFSQLNPLIINDDSHKRGKAVYVGYDQTGKPIPQLYKGGRIPRSHRSGIGTTDFLKAVEISSNPYFSLLAGEHLEHPEDLAACARQFSYGEKTGIDLPGEISGSVPTDLDCNRNGVYSMAIGQHSLVVTPLQTAVMLSAIANGGKVLKPNIVKMMIGKKEAKDAGGEQTFVKIFEEEIRKSIDMPLLIREMLLEGMARFSQLAAKSAWGTLSKMYSDYPEAISDLVELKNDLFGKSSTSESVETVNLDLKLGTNIYNHTWFGGFVFDPQKGQEHRYLLKNERGDPELVIVVYLRFGAWGKYTVPVAAQIAQKWRDIKKRQQDNTL